MNYFPASPIPEWPKRSRLGGRQVSEMIFEHENERGHDLRAKRILTRSQIYQDGAPLVCIQCGRHTTADGEIPCGH
jgi:hypothetical protein